MKLKIYVTLFASILIGTGCKKYLDEIPDKKLAIPSSLNDMKLLLDDYTTMNNNFPNSMEVLCDNYYVTSSNFSSITDMQIRNQYLWIKDESVNWISLYRPILNSNIVLDNLSIIPYNHQSEQVLYDNILGSALFFRSYYFYLCAQIFGQPYDKNTKSTDLGIVLRLNSDFNEQSRRSNNEETYQEIIVGFEKAIRLLPEVQDIKTRPTKSAAYGALARTFLTTQQYELAGRYADSCINLYGANNLLNFNNPSDVKPSASIPIQTFNKEVIFHLVGNPNSILSTSRAKVDPNLYNSYDIKDLRKTTYFKANTGTNSGTYAVKGGYDGLGGAIFGGIALDEMYLIRAEALARSGNTDLALKDLNKLLEHRWISGTYISYTATSSQDALIKILNERRKELIFRGTRWIDLRRLMKEQALAVTPQRVINDTKYELLPNSPRYTLQIPAEVINLSGIPQNP
jgi:tetratricopeptide (TPR) repeat protein